MGDIKKDICQILVQNIISSHEIDESSKKKIYYDLKFIMISRNMKKNFKFKIFKVVKLTFKIIFSQLLLRITFDDRF